MLIIFDIDGTLLGGETHDWASFDRALNTTLGFVPSPEFFSSLPDVTAESIAEAAIRATGREPTNGLATEIQNMYLRFLKAAHASDPKAFPVREGVGALLNHLSSLAHTAVAMATGDWLPTIRFKLNCAGLELSRFAMATASDARRRSEIIKLAAAKSGRSLAEAIYVGDGVWDLRACRELGIPFIGTGERIQTLLEAGAEAVCEPLEVGLFTDLLRRVARADKTLHSDPIFRRLAADEADRGYAVYMEAFRWLNDNGIRQWLVPLRRDVYDLRQERGENFGLFVEGELAVFLSLVAGAPAEWSDHASEQGSWWLHHLATAQSFRGKKLGEMAIRLAGQHLARLGVREFYLDCVDVEDFLPAFYARLGFAKIREQSIRYPSGNTFPMVLMRKALKHV